MKKKVLGTLFGAAFLITGAISLNTLEVDAQTTITCPEGDKYTCWKGGGITVYKGSGKTIIKLPQEK